jgi:putative inorganic carbon (HCO3(-)) transporter
MGMNNFRRVMPVLYPPFSGPFIADIAHAHNHLLQAGLDLGLPGLVAYVALWLGAGFLLVQIITQTGDRLYRTVALGLAGGLSAYFGYGLTDAVALGAKPGFVFWWAVGLVVATHQLHYRRRRQE